MANVDSIFGARLVNSVGGYVPQTMTCIVTAAVDATTDIFLGDFVTSQGTSSLSGDLDIYLTSVAQAAASDKILGFVTGVQPSRTYENQIYRTQATERVLTVCVDPYALFEIQCSGTFAVTDFGNNANITVGTGSTVTGLSGMELDQSTITTTETLPLKIIGMIPRADNEMGAHAKLLCMMNYCSFKDTTGQ